MHDYPPPTEDPLRAARGIVHGLLLTLGVEALLVLAALVWRLLT